MTADWLAHAILDALKANDTGAFIDGSLRAMTIDGWFDMTEVAATVLSRMSKTEPND